MTRPSFAARDRRALLLGLLVLGPPLVYLGAIRPYASALAEARDRLASDREALARERGLLTLAPQSATLRADLEATISASRERLFDAHDDGMAAAELGAYLTQLARTNQVWLQTAEPRNAETSPSGVRTLPIEIRAESDFQGMLAFLRAMEQGPKLLRVDRLTLAASPDTSVSTHALQLRATVTGYALGNPPTPKSATPRSRS